MARAPAYLIIGSALLPTKRTQYSVCWRQTTVSCNKWTTNGNMYRQDRKKPSQVDMAPISLLRAHSVRMRKALLPTLLVTVSTCIRSISATNATDASSTSIDNTLFYSNTPAATVTTTTKGL